jgi:hypothetical protein
MAAGPRERVHRTRPAGQLEIRQAVASSEDGEVRRLTASQAARNILQDAGVRLADNAASFLDHLECCREGHAAIHLRIARGAASVPSGPSWGARPGTQCAGSPTPPTPRVLVHDGTGRRPSILETGPRGHRSWRSARTRASDYGGQSRTPPVQVLQPLLLLRQLPVGRLANPFPSLLRCVTPIAGGCGRASGDPLRHGRCPEAAAIRSVPCDVEDKEDEVGTSGRPDSGPHTFKVHGRHLVGFAPPRLVIPQCLERQLERGVPPLR